MSDFPQTTDETLPPEGARIDAVCDRFEKAWKAGSPPRIEDFLETVTEPELSNLLRELVALEIELRLQQGEEPLPDEYRARFPSLEPRVLQAMIEKTPKNPPPATRHSQPAPPSFQSATQTKRMRCPNCHNPIDLSDAQSEEVLCPGCGSLFRIREAAQTTTTAPMKPLGKFQLLDRVGLGAFGAVWRARDTELDRIVALKIPHTGLLTAQTDLERFHREARSAAQLRHPGIVTVHEVVTLEGLPTIVSDFVAGVPLKDLLEIRPFTFRETAEFMAGVAEAVDYAHSLGVVHRDLKPANIMVEYAPVARPESSKGVVKPEPTRTTPFEDSGRPTQSNKIGRPLVMDFGLALRDEAEVTMTMDGHVLGTPAYMSPEQAAGLSHQADRRSDVYSLGVILYQLLCAELPFRGSRNMILHQVLHEEPRPPRKVNDKIPRDLETICLKALAKAPARRYGSARELADDSRRFLKGEPIQARPVGHLERAIKWARRRPAVLAVIVLGLLAMMALVAAIVGILYNTQLQQALAAETRAKEMAQEAQKAEAREKEQAEAAQREAHRQEQLSRNALEQANASLTLLLDTQKQYAASIVSKGELAKALPLYEQAVKTYQQLYAKDQFPQGHPDLAQSLTNLGTLLRLRGEYSKAFPYCQQAVGMYGLLYPPDRFPQGHPKLAASLTNLGVLLQDRGEADKAVPCLKRALSMYQAIYPNDKYPHGHPALAASLSNLATSLQAQKEYEAARPYLEQALTINRELLGAEHLDTATSLNNLGVLLLRKGDYKEARPYLEQALEIQKKALGTEHPSTAHTLSNLGMVFQARKEYEAARPYLERALAINQRVLGEHPMTARSLTELGDLLALQGEYVGALDYYNRALGMYQRLYPQGNPRSIEAKQKVEECQKKASDKAKTH